MAPFVVGIGGCSSSGKSSVARLLVSSLPHGTAVAVHMDDYYFREGDPRLPPIIPELGMHNWDHPSAFDLDRVVEEVYMLAGDENIKLVVVEGIVVYDRKALVEVFDKKYFFTLTRQDCAERRRGRKFPGLPDTSAFFDTIVWPSYLRAHDLARKTPGVVFLDSTRKGISELYADVSSDLQCCLE